MDEEGPLWWLPDDLTSCALRLARADALAEQVGMLAATWSRAIPYRLVQERRDDVYQVLPVEARPVPPLTSLYFSEGINHVRSSLENVL